MLSALARGAACLLGARDRSFGVARLIAGLGEAAGACRVVVIENVERPDGQIGMFTLHEWVAAGYPSRIADATMQNKPYQHGWIGSLRRDTPVVCITTGLDPERSNGFRRHGIGGFVSVPLYRRGELWGALTVATATSELPWHETEVDAIRLAASIIGTALERAAAEEALRTSEARFRDAIESIDDGLCMYDRDDRLVLANQQYRDIFRRGQADIVGYSFEELVRQGVDDVLYRDAIGREEEWLAERLELHRNPGETREIQMWDGRWIRVMEQRSAEGGLVGIRRDVTALKEREFELQRARDRAETANRTKTAFLGTMSHELRTPLNAILGFAEVLEGELFGKIGDDRYREYAHDIRTSGQHLLSVIDDILDVSRIEAGRVELHREPVALDTLIDGVAHTMAIPAGRAGISIRRSPPCGVSMTADPRAMRQILLNLVSNAIKFSPAGSTVRLSTAVQPDMVRIAVTDQGVGIDEKDLPFLGQPFVQVGDTRGAQKQGTGLGLAISRGLVTLHGGQLAFESKQGQGTTVTVELPR